MYDFGAFLFFFFFSSRRRHTRCLSDWSSDVCSSDLTCVVRCSPGYPARGRSLLFRAVMVTVASRHPGPRQGLEHRFELRSEERRVGKECRARWWRRQKKKELNIEQNGCQGDMYMIRR